MRDLSGFKILILDYGNGISFAMKMAEKFGTVYYWSGPYVTNSFPIHNVQDIANNVPNLVKVKEWAEAYEDADMVAFCDSMEPALQHWMRSHGMPVFGCGFADRLEHDRLYLKETLKELGLPVGTYYTAHGLDELEQILIGAENVYCKGAMRGNGETWFHKNWRLTKRQFMKLRTEMGLYANRETYVVEEKIECIGETGFDGFIVGGVFAPMGICGVERKDASFLGRFVRYQLLPECIKMVTDKLAPVFEQMEYNGQYSNEIMISKDKRGFLLDNSCRVPSPPGEVMMEAITNYPEVVWMIAHGRMPSIQYDKPWVAQVIIKSDIAAEDDSPVIVPDEFKNNVKIKNLSIDEDGTWYYVPSPGLGMREIGSVCASGNSAEEAIRNAEKICDAIEGFDIKTDANCLHEAKKSIDKLIKAGIDPR
jgi:phosphoribosylamine-glycine ligase